MAEHSNDVSKKAGEWRVADRRDKKALESGGAFAPKFDDHGLLPVITTDVESGQVLMFAYMNEESLRLTLEKGEMVYWSRSRNKLWHKGETSGHVQQIVELRTDCDQDVLLAKVRQIGEGCCHTGRYTCFYRTVPLFRDGTLNEDGTLPLTTDLDPTYDPETLYGKQS